MERTSEPALFRGSKALATSLPMRFALVPLAGFGVALGMQSTLAGLGIAVLVLVSVLIGLKLGDERRRRREAREHIAGLSRW